MGRRQFGVAAIFSGFITKYARLWNAMGINELKAEI
jgi:hypothetical protein